MAVTGAAFVYFKLFPKMRSVQGARVAAGGGPD